MLLLTRKAGESILLDDEIEITVTRIGKSRVKIGIRAPDGVHVRRSELIEWEQEVTSLASEQDRSGRSLESCAEDVDDDCLASGTLFAE